MAVPARDFSFPFLVEIRNVKSIIYASAQTMLSFLYERTIEIFERQRKVETKLERDRERDISRKRNSATERINSEWGCRVRICCGDEPN